MMPNREQSRNEEEAEFTAAGRDFEIESQKNGESKPVKTPLMIAWREFSVDPSRGEYIVNGNPIRVCEISNSLKGTGHSVWDGALVLGKYIEHAIDLKSKNVLELGCGTGLVSLTCASLGASHVVATDLNYVLENVEQNIRVNKLSNMTALELDWYDHADKTIQKFRGTVDLIVAADVVWVPGLIEPFTTTLRALCDANGGLEGIYLSHQTRALKTDSILFNALCRNHLDAKLIPIADMHPDYRSSRIKLYKIEDRRKSQSS